MSEHILPPIYVGALPPKYPGIIKMSDSGGHVKLLQEFLSLEGYNLQLDGDFGPATREAVKSFNHKVLGLPEPHLFEATWSALTNKVKRSLQCLSFPNNTSIYNKAVAYAERHLVCGARELGGENLGPWVRLYMQGNEGHDYPWCAGFVSFVLKQVAETVNMAMDPIYTLSCDELGKWADSKGCLYTDLPDVGILGSIFLLKKASDDPHFDYIHTGFVTSYNDGAIATIEGNTNAAGAREGVGVMRRFRSLKNIHLITGYLGDM